MNGCKRTAGSASLLVLLAASAVAQTAAQPGERASDQATAARSRVEKVQIEERRAADKRLAAERFAAERVRLLESPVFRAAKLWTPAVADDAAARLAKVAELCPGCRLIRPAEAIPLRDLGGGSVPARGGGEQPTLWLAADASPALRERLRAECPECQQIDRPILVAPPQPGGGTVVFQSIDPGGWSPTGTADPCAVPPMVMLASGGLDQEIRAALARAAGKVNVTVKDYEAAAPAACDRDLLMYRLSVAGQLLGGGGA
ncbi:MAG: hypothetical protein IPJ17_21570 [Holophagales bacterium]|nr:MAG: hypothetical protein IPJ17_21570 [Holophagales bacterium]